MLWVHNYIPYALVEYKGIGHVGTCRRLVEVGGRTLALLVVIQTKWHNKLWQKKVTRQKKIRISYPKLSEAVQPMNLRTVVISSGPSVSVDIQFV